MFGCFVFARHQAEREWRSPTSSSTDLSFSRYFVRVICGPTESVVSSFLKASDKSYLKLPIDGTGTLLYKHNSPFQECIRATNDLNVHSTGSGEGSKLTPLDKR